MMMTRLRRSLALVTSAALLASLTVATVGAPASAAKPKCQGKTATIVGTKKGEVIRGTNRADVIVARGGHDIVYGRGGNDTICGGPGNDRIVGAGGKDLLLGQFGRDKLYGGAARDRLLGGPANDRLAGGPGNDACLQGSGSGLRLSCERPVPPVAAPPTLIDLNAAKVLAVAYSDIDGLDGYSTGDVMIARLMDTSGDGQPGTGDTIEMGRYPTDHAATSFADWGVKTHTVASIERILPDTIKVLTTASGKHLWDQLGGPSDNDDIYNEAGASGFSSLNDFPAPGKKDDFRFEAGSPSQPVSPIPFTANPGAGDDGFVDVELNYPEVP